jgi:thiol-disulfide isomerase/thioredoxin
MIDVRFREEYQVPGTFNGTKQLFPVSQTSGIMSELDDGNGENEESQQYHHQFTEQELNQMLYYWDEEAAPVVEYHYLKRSWMHETTVNSSIDINDDNEEDYVYLELDTSTDAHVVEFYSPHCPHCHRLKEHYIELADEMQRRATDITVHFSAVSCTLYPMVCRAYDIVEHPFVMGFAVGMPIEEPGVELNPHGDNTQLTAENIALALEIVLAPEEAPSRKRDGPIMEAQVNGLAHQAAFTKTSWHEYSDQTLRDRYHNAGCTLASTLHTALHSRQSPQAPQPDTLSTSKWLDPKRERALLEFLQLVDWATPVHWSVRSGLIPELLDRWMEAMKNHTTFLEILKRQQSTQLFGDVYEAQGLQSHARKRRFRWTIEGLGVDVPIHHDDRSYHHHGYLDSLPDHNMFIYDANSQWTEACTHGQRGAGFSCGLWDLLHIISIGSSMPQPHQLYGYRAGYWVAPQQVGLVIKNFLSHFFTCEVCRHHFVENYDTCGQNHCHRLESVLPVLSTSSKYQGSKPPPSWQQEQDATTTTSNRALAMWLFEFHNVVNVRLMKEAAETQGRHVTEEERVAAIFPTKQLCPTCWWNDTHQNDTNITYSYDPEEVYAFLKQWYW